MSDSLVIAESIELQGAPGGTVSTDPRCAGAVFRLMPGFDLGTPQPTTDFTASLLLDGERPFGRRSSNRTITLPVLIKAPDFFTLASAREVLLQAIDAQFWTLRWTRDTAGQFAGSSTSMPMLLDCFRAQPATVRYGGPDGFSRYPYALLDLTFSALPFGRSDLPVVADFQAPIAGKSAPASPVTVDAWGSVSGAHWTASAIGPGGASAHWSTGTSGVGSAATYTATGLSLNLTGLSALTVWAGFGSTGFFADWAQKQAGPVTFAFTLTDGTHSASFAVTRRAKASNNSAVPVFAKVRAPLPSGSALGSLNLAAVTGYTVKVTSRAAGDLPFTDLYLSQLLAVPVTNPASSAPAAGAVYDMAGILGTARTPVSLQFQQPAGTTSTVVKRFTIAGGVTWLCPAGVTAVKCETVGAGGRGAHNSGGTSGGGGGGGEYAAEATLAVTAGTSYAGTVGKGGSTGSGTAGSTTFAGDSVTVTAHGGSNGGTTTAGAAGGTGSSSTTHHNGGAGGAGYGSGPGDGGGGGGSGGPTGAGGAGGAGSIGGAGTGGAAGSGGSPSSAGSTGGTAGKQPGGGGGGSSDVLGQTGGNGGDGEIVLTYTQTASFKTLVAHRPRPDAPDTLTPFVSPAVTDVPDGSTEYPVPSLVAGQNARFDGTYTVVLVASSWHSGSSARTLTVTVKQYEQPGGTSYSQSVALPVTPNSLASNMAVLGELTLPGQALAGDNLDCYFTVTVTSTDTADRFQDVLFLDSQGQTLIIQSPNGYISYWIDEPATDRDLGNVMGSVFDRADAVSVMQWATISGPTLYANPAPGDNQLLLVYAVEGAPSAEMTYYPRWQLDRTA
jgi:hypothetical protein